jgi:thymidylate synthase ThyX
MPYQVKIIRDSVSPAGTRLTTFELAYPRFVHAELMTHRVFSRNAASNRAIPVAKILQQVIDDPAMPVHWGKNQSGMQAREELGERDQATAKYLWLTARDQAVRVAKDLVLCGAHKQIVNRVLEPFQFIHTIVSATTFENFFVLRCHPDAQPEIKHLADMMYAAYHDADRTPAKVFAHTWHRPYVGYEDFDEAGKRFGNAKDQRELFLTKLSVARVARVSYLNHDGKRDWDKDLALHDSLKESGHWSPFEHVAQALSQPHQVGNFRGWKQYRKTFPNESGLFSL